MSAVSLKAKQHRSAQAAQYRAAKRPHIRKMKAKHYKTNRSRIKARARWARIEKLYSITKQQYDVMFAMGKGACWVCKKKIRRDGRPLRLYVEHDHNTQRVRGLACYKCNRFLIWRHKDGRLLRAAAEYLDSTFDAREIAA